MKMIKLFSFTLLFGTLLMLGAANAQTTAPSSQFGIGAFAGGSVTGGGFQLQYAISPSVQIGLALGIAGQSSDGNSSTSYSTDIYGRFLFEGIVNPFIQAGFRRTSFEQGSTTGVTVTVDNNQIYGAFGLEYFFNRNVGVYAAFDVLALNLDPSATFFGANNGRVGVEWYFSP